MTEPRRVPTEVERAAAAVEAGHAWRHTANSRPGFATWPNTAPGSPSWWQRHGDEPPTRPAPERIEPAPTFEDLLSDPRGQFDPDDELLPHILAFGTVRDDRPWLFNPAASTTILGARPAPECLTSHPQMHADCDGCTCSCHPPVSFADQLIARHGQPMRDALDRARVRYEADKAAARQPRRRWWHRLTRRNP